MINSTRLTPLGIEKKKAKLKDLWLSDDVGTRGGGRLVVRISTSGSKIFYFRYSIDGKRDAIPIGPFTLQAVNGRYTLEEARAVANDYAALHRNPASKDVKTHLVMQESARVATIEAAKKEIADAALKASADSHYSLEALCDAYTKHLIAQGKQSAKNVGSQLKLHVKNSACAKMPARSVTSKHITALLRDIIKTGKGRTAARVRSYLHAAYGLALKAELDATASSDLEQFDIAVNPVASTATLSQFSKARDRFLSDDEMGEIWRRLCSYGDEAPLAVRAIRVALLLGGQRGEQLLRVNWVTDIDPDVQRITIYDRKGNRAQARLHLLPIVGKASDEIKALIKRSEMLGSQLLFQGARQHLGQDALSKCVKDMAVDFQKKNISKQQFQFSDLRRTAETVLAGLGIHKDIRAQLQSHGLGGVQDRHYDMHSYFEEKKNAIKTWQGYLERVGFDTPIKSNVTPIKHVA